MNRRMRTRVTRVFSVSEDLEESSNLILERGIKHKLQEVSRSEAAGGFQYHISLLRTIETDTDQNKEKRGLPCCEGASSALLILL